MSVTSANNKFETKKNVERIHRTDIVRKEVSCSGRAVRNKPNQLKVTLNRKQIGTPAAP